MDGIGIGIGDWERVGELVASCYAAMAFYSSVRCANCLYFSLLFQMVENREGCVLAVKPLPGRYVGAETGNIPRSNTNVPSDIV